MDYNREVQAQNGRKESFDSRDYILVIGTEEKERISVNKALECPLVMYNPENNMKRYSMLTVALRVL